LVRNFFALRNKVQYIDLLAATETSLAVMAMVARIGFGLPARGRQQTIE
jgi:hypothetical protein